MEAFCQTWCVKEKEGTEREETATRKQEKQMEEQIKMKIKDLIIREDKAVGFQIDCPFLCTSEGCSEGRLGVETQVQKYAPDYNFLNCLCHLLNPCVHLAPSVGLVRYTQ